jgi:hypothetical protein
MYGNGVLLSLNILSYTAKTSLAASGNVSVSCSRSVGSVGKKFKDEENLLGRDGGILSDKYSLINTGGK